MRNARILVAGGDGTISSVLEYLYKEEGSKPPVGVMPLGTGNDLAKVLRWGNSISADIQSEKDLNLVIKHYLKEVSSAHVSALDRWTVSLSK